MSLTTKFRFVESVEFVETDHLTNLPPVMRTQIDAFNSSTNLQPVRVETVGKNDLAASLSTLSTKMKQLSVEEKRRLFLITPMEIKCFPQIPQLPQEYNHGREEIKLIFEWLNIVVGEGHIEPSQPEVGRILGWPCRSILANSLFIDFQCWCRNKGIIKWQTPRTSLFCSMADRVFSRLDESYIFPSIHECQNKFNALRRNYESI